MSRLFQPFTLGEVKLRNRIVMPPMGTRMASSEGCAQPVHAFHYGARALGGTALIMVEATGVENQGRCHPTNLGLWTDQQSAAMCQVCDAIRRCGAVAGIQLQHGGRKGYPAYGLVSPSALPFAPDHPTPRALSKAEIGGVVEAFAQAAYRAWQCGFQVIEIHGAHGYLIHQFLSPHSNRREDDYGGDLNGRLRFALEVIAAVKAILPTAVPLLIRVSANEYLPEGYSLDDMVTMCCAFAAAGVNAIDVSSGGNSPQSPQTYPGYQVPAATIIRERAGLPVIAAGRLGSPEVAAAVVEMELTDLVGIGRGLLANPHWPLLAAEQLDCAEELRAQSAYLRAIGR